MMEKKWQARILAAALALLAQAMSAVWAAMPAGEEFAKMLDGLRAAHSAGDAGAYLNGSIEMVAFLKATRKKASGPFEPEAISLNASYRSYSAASVSPAGTASSESPTPPLTSMKLRRRVSSNARRRRA
jgi:hypothetical protein